MEIGICIYEMNGKGIKIVLIKHKWVCVINTVSSNNIIHIQNCYNLNDICQNGDNALCQPILDNL